MAAADVRVWEHEDPPTSDELANLARDAAALLCVHGDTIDTHLLERCPDLSIVAVASRGYDDVDVSAARARRIAITNTPGVLKDATADLAFALILAVRRRIVEADRYVRAGLWRSNPLDLLVGHDVHSSRLGIVGYGEIGRAVARRATGFAMDVRHYARHTAADAASSWLELDELLATSDIVTLHTPLTAETQLLIGERELRLMKPTASLINTARGGVVDQAALIRALKEGWIYSAGLDVQAVEPNPDSADELLELENCVVLPHIGSASHSARAAQIDLAVDNVLAHLEGRPLISPIALQENGRPATGASASPASHSRAPHEHGDTASHT
jgi:glyoxylate reductase